MKYMNSQRFHWNPWRNLQLFTEGEGNEGGSSEEGNGSGSGEGESGNVGDGTLSFDDFLKGEGNQAEFDRRVQKAINTAVAKAQQKWKALSDNNLSEAEKLAKMTKEEKTEYEMEKLKKQLADLQKQNNRTEMAKTARKILADEEISIPDDLIGLLVADEADGTKKSVEAFAKMFKEAVQDGVKQALKGKVPKGGAGGGTITKEQILAVKDPSERQKLIAENIRLFQ